MLGNDLKVPEESWRTLYWTGVSLVLLSWTIWYTDSPGEHGENWSFWVLILIMGMNGWEPGANE